LVVSEKTVANFFAQKVFWKWWNNSYIP